MDVCGNLTSCSICLSAITDETKFRKLDCNHKFHVKCVDTWFKNNNTCPECRRKQDFSKFIIERFLSNAISHEIFHAITCVVPSDKGMIIRKTSNWIRNFNESVELAQNIEAKFPPRSDYALVDNYLRLSNYSIGPPYSTEELRYGFNKLKLEWKADDYPTVYHEKIIKHTDVEYPIKSVKTQLIEKPTMIANEEFKQHIDRTASFRNFPCNYISVSNLALFGFYFTPQLGSDYCKCAYCGMVVGDFHPGVSPRMLHYVFNPNCIVYGLAASFFEEIESL